MNAAALQTATAHNTDATRLDVAEVAKAVRAAIKAQTGKALPAGLKCTVRISRFSMGCSLDLDVTAAPFNTMNAERVQQDEAGVSPYSGEPLAPYLSAQAQELLAQLEAIVAPYHDDRSDLQSDYHCVNFYKHVEIAGALRNADRAERIAEFAAAAE